VQVSNSPTFGTLLYNDTVGVNFFDPVPNLVMDSVYFWRVRSVDNNCGHGVWSQVFSFQTSNYNTICEQYDSNDIPVPITGAGNGLQFSEIDVAANYNVSDVQVKNLVGEHTWMGDLTFSLHAPNGDSTILFSNICGEMDNFDLSLSDNSQLNTIPCPPTTGLNYLPSDAFSTFQGTSSTGTWKLRIEDNHPADDGVLQNWSLILCQISILETPSHNSSFAQIDFNQNFTFNSSHISGDCGNGVTPNFMVTAVPEEGSLVLNGSVLNVGDIFTQSDVNTGALTYNHTSNSTTGIDGFEYVMLCLGGIYQGGLYFPILINQTASLFELSGTMNEWVVYPNPTNGLFTINFNSNVDNDFGYYLFDVCGKVVQSGSFQAHNNNSFDLRHLAEGLYHISIVTQGNEFSGSQKLILNK
jgi:subtilisin-like proprotein convertase family protein